MIPLETAPDQPRITNITEIASDSTTTTPTSVHSSRPIFQRQVMRYTPNLPGRRNDIQFNAWSITFPTNPHSISSNRNEVNNNRDRRSSRDNTSTTTTDRWQWVVKSPRTIPKCWKLECTSLHLSQHVQPETVSRRISQFLRIHSISAQYHDDASQVECTTSCLVKLCIFLWQSQHEVIVEVQRRSGSCLVTRKLRQELYSFIQSEAPTQQQRLYQVPETIILCGNNEQGDGCCKAEVLTTERLLSSNCMDEVILGMENLLAVVTTTPTAAASTATVSLCISKTLICGKQGRCDNLRTLFGQYFHNIERDEDGCYDQCRHFGILHTLALQILASALTIISRQEAISIDVRSWFWHNVVNALVYNVASIAEHRSPMLQEASLSAKCLHLLLRLEPRFTRLMLEERLLNGLVHALECGRDHHLELERESEILMSSLSN